jgi:thiamine pyrophosphate-dependent acetolactate synthase large subunit-like protein
MCTLQGLWTKAREKLDVTTMIFANRSYAILNIELARVGAQNPGSTALSTLDLHNPTLTGCTLHLAWVWKPAEPKRLRSSPANLTAQ